MTHELIMKVMFWNLIDVWTECFLFLFLIVKTETQYVTKWINKQKIKRTNKLSGNRLKLIKIIKN